jgi:hypothetical protein
MMNGKKNGCRTADIQGGAVRQPGEQNLLYAIMPRKIRMVAPVWVIKI